MAPNDNRPVGTNYTDKGPKPSRGKYVQTFFFFLVMELKPSVFIKYAELHI